MNSPVEYLKVPEGIFKKANEQKLFSQLGFYYKLKGLKTEGFFKFEEIKSIVIKTKLGLSTVYKGINDLINLGLLIKIENGYQLCKYDDLFSFFGYDLKIKTNKRTKTSRKGNFKLFLIKTGFDFNKLVEAEEIALNIRRQNYIIKKKQKALSPTSLSLISKNILDEQLIKEKFGINLYTSLACRTIATLLGFKSSSKGHSILSSMEKSGKVFVERRRDVNNLPMVSRLYLSI